MTVGTVTLKGQYFNGEHPVGSEATLVFTGREAALIGAQVSQRYVATQIRVSPRIGGADRFVAFPDGGQFQCPSHPLLDRLPHDHFGEGAVAWLEQRVAVAVASVAVIAAALLAGYFIGLPAAAARIAARVPMETEQALGRETVAWLDEKKWFAPTELDEEDQQMYRDGFAELRAGLPMEKFLRLEFRNSSFVGPNAFALPGGTIVITDAMIDAAESPEEVFNVLAHEIGHVERRHALRMLLQQSALAVVAAAVTADAASLSGAIAGLPAVLAQTKYSREFETEADDFGFALAKKHGYSPEGFASLMERLADEHGGPEGAFAYVSSHPATTERVRHAREAAK
jgi:predicted Zn-dependent protease